jgi:hypothetical protein
MQHLKFSKIDNHFHIDNNSLPLGIDINNEYKLNYDTNKMNIQQKFYNLFQNFTNTF